MSVELMPRVRHTIAVDYSFDGSRGVVGIGVVVHEYRVRGRHGPVIARFAEAYLDVPSRVGEMFAVFRALEIAAESGYRCVTVRSDYNQMRRQLKKDLEQGSGDSCPDLHGAILRLARQFDTMRFAWIARSKNHEAHKLAWRGREAELRTRGDVQWYECDMARQEDPGAGDPKKAEPAAGADGRYALPA